MSRPVPPPVEMPSRPESDRELDEDVVRLAVRAEFPEIEARTVEHLGSGWAFDAWLVDGHRVVQRGWGFARSVLGAYDLPVEDDLLERVRYHAQVRAVEWLADTVRRGGDPEVHLRWVRHAFSMKGDRR